MYNSPLKKASRCNCVQIFYVTLSYASGLYRRVEQLMKVLQILCRGLRVVRVTQEHTAEETTRDVTRDHELRRQLTHLCIIHTQVRTLDNTSCMANYSQ